MDTRSLVAALLLIHVTKATDAHADQAGFPPPAPAATASASGPSTPVPLPDVAPAPESPAVAEALPAPTPPPATVPPSSRQASIPPPSTSDSWIAGPQQYRRPTLVEQVAELQRSVRELEEERQRKLAEEAPTWAAHVNFLNLLFDEVTLGVDYAVLDRLQATAQASYRFKNRVNVTDNSGAAVGAGIRVYPASNGYRGWYVSPTVSYVLLTAENVVTAENGTLQGLAVIVATGYQWVWKPVMFRMGVGFGRFWETSSEVNGQWNTELAGWQVGLDGALGVAF